jgi:polyisoprenoid-binding protein YceI
MKLLQSFLLTTSFILSPLVWAGAEQHDIDPVHSNVSFQVRHFVSKLPGSFAKFSGRIDYVPENPSQSTVEASVDVKSVNTNNAKRDDHLRGVDFFNVTKYPLAEFKSKSWVKTAENQFDVLGDLTINEITKSVLFKVSYLGAQTTANKTVAGWSATATISRKDFGVSYGAGAIGDEVILNLELQTVIK